MKNTLISVIFLLALTFPSLAESVSEVRARSYACAFLQKVAPSSASVQNSGSNAASSDGLSLAFCGVRSHTKSSLSSAAPFYAFNRNGGGYVIISGDDNMAPVIGYSANGCLDKGNLPPSLVWWLDGVEKTVSDFRKKASASSKVADAWLEVSNVVSSKAGNGEYTCLTPEWNQKTPFNDSCPVVASQTSVTGCLPLAVSQVMCYHGYPSMGSGTLPSYTFSYNNVNYTVDAHELNTTYDWTSLKAVTSTNASSQTLAVRTNLARLIADVGQSVKAIYGPSETSGQSANIIPALGTYFGYRKDARYLLRDMYSETQWYSMIVDEIKAGRPLLYGGQSITGGHEFVLDGVNSNYFDYVHINFGWGGSSNGWYNIGANFYGNQDGIFGFMPDDGSGPSSFKPGDVALLGGRALKITSGTLAPGSSFQVAVTSVFCHGESAFSGKLKLVRLNKNGEYKDDLSSARTSNIEIGYGISYSQNCQLQSAVEFGDQIALYRKRDCDSSWGPVPVSVQGESTATCPLSGQARIVASPEYLKNSVFFFSLSNTPYSYLYSTYALSSSSLGCLCYWSFYVDGVLYKKVETLNTRYIALDKAGEWMVRCDMVSLATTKVEQSIYTKFIVK